MRRRIVITVLLALVLGFVTSWAVAWWQALYSHWSRYHRGLAAGSLLWQIELEAVVAEERLVFVGGPRHEYGTSRFLIREATLDQVREVTPARHVPGWARGAIPKLRQSVYVRASGWPARCLTEWKAHPPESPDAGGSFISITTALGGLADARLPVLVYWPGMLANTSLYGAAWFVLLFAPGSIRRVRRRKKGRCVGCGYDVSASPGACPECGRKRSR